MKELCVAILIFLMSVPCFSSPQENLGENTRDSGGAGNHLTWDGENMVPMTPLVQLKLQGIDYLKEGIAIKSKAQQRIDLEPAINKFDEALKIFGKVQSDYGKGYALIGAGQVYYKLGQYAKAREYYEKSLQIWKKMGEFKGAAIMLHNIGLTYDSLGQKVKAREYYEQSIQMKENMIRNLPHHPPPSYMSPGANGPNGA